MGNDSVTLYPIWCMSHRLNLVIRDFERVSDIKHVLKFSNWFASKRKAVAYRRWLCDAHPRSRYKKIPKPSETRWCFFRDVIAALLVQKKEIDEFLCQDEDFVALRRTLWRPDWRTGMNYTEAFLNNPFILSHFSFA